MQPTLPLPKKGTLSCLFGFNRNLEKLGMACLQEKPFWKFSEGLGASRKV